MSRRVESTAKKRDRRRGKRGGCPTWVDDEERRSRNAALRGRPQPASERYQRFIESNQGQRRLPLSKTDEET
jgi:hypothetical protein